MQTFACLNCEAEFTRPPTRGQRPRWCPDCVGLRLRWKPCVACGEMAAIHVSSRTCSSACAEGARSAAVEARRQKRLPVLHPNPDPLTWLPARHPAVTPRRHASLPGQIFVSGRCAWCEESFTALAADWERRSVYCSKRCGRAAAKARRGHFSPTPAVRAAIYERDGWVCQLCFEPVDPELGPSDIWAATLDHIVCRSWTLIPDHRPENLRLAHRWCNSVRSDETHYPGEVLAA